MKYKVTWSSSFTYGLASMKGLIFSFIQVSVQIYHRFILFHRSVKNCQVITLQSCAYDCRVFYIHEHSFVVQKKHNPSEKRCSPMTMTYLKVFLITNCSSNMTSVQYPVKNPLTEAQNRAGYSTLYYALSMSYESFVGSVQEKNKRPEIHKYFKKTKA